MKVVVTGGAGFIGSHVVDHLVEAGHHVDVVDVRPPHRADVGHRHVDIADLAGLVDAFRGAEVVFHLAAFADVNDVEADPVGAIDANVGATARVWEACRRAGVRRAVLASTVWVYGSAVGEGPLDEDAPIALHLAGHLYTSSKLAAEQVVHGFHTLYGQEFTILRYGIPYGPRMRSSLVIPRFVTKALAGEPITIQGDGSQCRNYVYVDDLAAAHVLALGDDAANEVLNLEGTEAISIRHIADSIATVLDRPLEVLHLPARAGDYDGRPVSAERAHRLLGWKARVRFDDGVRRYVAWHIEHVLEVAAPEVDVPPPAPVATSGPWTDRIEVAAGLAAAVGLATLVVPALSTTAAALSLPRAMALGGTAVGGVAAWLTVRRTAHLLPVMLSAAVTVVAVWLLAQAPAGPLSLVLGGLLGVGVGAGLGHIPAGRRCPRVALGLTTAAALVLTAAVDRHALFWLAAVPGIVAPISQVARRERRRRTGSVSWRLAAATVAATAVATSWVGATSASATWFGPLVHRGSGDRREVAITFDAFPHVRLTSQVLGVLDAHRVRAAFFLDARGLAHRGNLLRALMRHDHLLADQGYRDDHDAWLDPRFRELGRAQRAFAEHAGVCPTYFRPPHGRHTPLMARVVRQHDMTMVTWDVRVAHVGSDDADVLARHVLDDLRPGSIVDFDLHDDEATAGPVVLRTLSLVLDGLRARRLVAVGLDQLVGTPGYAGRC